MVAAEVCGATGAAGCATGEASSLENFPNVADGSPPVPPPAADGVAGVNVVPPVISADPPPTPPVAGLGGA